MHVPFIFLFAILSVSLGAQSLTLTSGRAHKTIKAGQLIEVSQAGNTTSDPDFCFCPSWTGRFLGIEDGQLMLRIHRAVERQNETDSLITMRTTNYGNNQDAYPIIAIDPSSITSITRKGNGNRIRDFTTLQSIGIFLTISSIGTFTTATYVEQPGDVLLAGLAELLSGLIIVGVAKQKEFILTEERRQREGQRIWKIAYD